MGQSGIDIKPAGFWKQRWLNLPRIGIISDLESARNTGKRGAHFAYVCAVVLLLHMHLPPSSLAIVDAALFAGLGFGISRMSRACAVSVLLVYVATIALSFGKTLLDEPIGQLPIWLKEALRGQLLTEFATGLVLVLETLLLGWLLMYPVDGIRGTFAYHRYKNDQAASAAISS